MKNLFYILILLFLSSCSTVNRCDCAREAREAKASTASTPPAAVAPVVPPAPKMEEEKTVSSADLEVINKMIKAVDDYVFREQKDDFTTLCKDLRFDCSVNDKRYPAGKKKQKRKIAPFVSGSKTGLQKGERVSVRYSFYP